MQIIYYVVHLILLYTLNSNAQLLLHRRIHVINIYYY